MRNRSWRRRMMQYTAPKLEIRAKADRSLMIFVTGYIEEGNEEMLCRRYQVKGKLLTSFFSHSYCALES